jgi:hypothetical protein
MTGLNYKVTLSVAVLVAATALSAFRVQGNNDGKGRLRGIISPTEKTMITYDADKHISRLVTIHGEDASKYTTVRIPVYKDGKLMQTMFADNESAAEPMLFSTLDYNKANQVIRIKYYTDNQVSGYDSLAYNATGNISARYFFNKGAHGFENHNAQLYTWDIKGNVAKITNMGRPPGALFFTQSSVATYRYDAGMNANKNIPDLIYLTDITAANISATNVVAEEISTDGKVTQANSFEYAYNAQQYPYHILAKYASKETVSTDLEWE